MFKLGDGEIDFDTKKCQTFDVEPSRLRIISEMISKRNTSAGWMMARYTVY